MIPRTVGLLMLLLLALPARSAAPAAAAAAPAAATMMQSLFGKQGAALLGQQGDKLMERNQKLWDGMVKVNKDVKDLMQTWAPEKAQVLEGMLALLGASEKALGEPLPARRAGLSEPRQMKDVSQRMREVREVQLPAPGEGEASARGQQAEGPGEPRESLAVLLRKRASVAPVLLAGPGVR